MKASNISPEKTMADLIPELQSGVAAVQAVAQKVDNATEPALDLAALAATNIAQAEGAKDPDAAAQKIMSLDSRLTDLESKFGAALNAVAAALEKAKGENAEQIAQSIAPVAEALGLSQQRVAQIEAAVPDLVAAKEATEKAIADFEAELPADWKQSIANLLLLGKRHFGL
jgi:hypothetical protein